MKVNCYTNCCLETEVGFRNRLVYGGKVVSASREVVGNGGEVFLCAHVKDKVHSDDDVEQEVAVKKPASGIVSDEAEDDVSVVRYGNGVFRRRQISLLQVTLQQTSPVEVESVLQVDFLHVLVRRSTDTDYVERISVQVERVR